MNSLLGALFRLFVAVPLTIIFAIFVFRDTWYLYHIPWTIPSREVLVGIGIIGEVFRAVFGPTEDAALLGHRVAQADKFYASQEDGELTKFVLKTFMPAILVLFIWAGSHFYHWWLSGYLAGG